MEYEDMERGVLEFDLDEDRNEYERYIRSAKEVAAIREFDNYLRKIVKSGNDPIKAKYAEEFRSKLYEIFEDSDIEI